MPSHIGRELLGLMTVHLILLAANKLWPGLKGKVRLYFDCLGALKIARLPPHRIPARCKQSDILKKIMVNCSSLTFAVDCSHVVAHQDNEGEYESLKRQAQINCVCDGTANSVIWNLAGEQLPCQEIFLLENVTIFVGGTKVSSTIASVVRFWVHKQLANWNLISLKLLSKH